MKIKKLLILILSIITIIICVCFAGCQDETNKIDTSQVGEGRFGVIAIDTITSNYDNPHYIYTLYDKETKIEYALVIYYKGGTSLTVLLDENGKPLLYEGD